MGRRRILLLVVILGVLAILLSARPGDPALYPPKPGEPRARVYLIDDDFHSDLALPREAFDTAPVLAQAVARTTKQSWILVGWGDARFYRGEGYGPARLLDGLRALFGLHNASVVRLYGLTHRPDQAFTEMKVTTIDVSRAGLARMVTRIDRSVSRDADSNPVAAGGPLWAEEGFFQSPESFNLGHLCNHWTAEVLNAGGLPVDLAVDTLPIGLRWDLRLRSGAGSAQASPRPRASTAGPTAPTG